MGIFFWFFKMVSVIAFLALFASAALAAVPHDFTLHFSGNYSQAGVSTLAASSTQTFVFIGPKVGAVATEQTVHLVSGVGEFFDPRRIFFPLQRRRVYAGGTRLAHPGGGELRCQRRRWALRGSARTHYGQRGADK